jgi:hypothetical protein
MTGVAGNPDQSESQLLVHVGKPQMALRNKTMKNNSH